MSVQPVPSWRPGHLVWPTGRTKVVVLSGAGSQTGDAERDFSGLMRWLAVRGGYDTRRDLLEASYAGRQEGEHWLPRPYRRSDTRQPLLHSAEAVAGTLEWYREVLPPDTRFCIVGYSLGGVVMLDGVTMAVARDRRGWAARIPAVVTIASPVHGCNVGPLVNWVWLFTPDPDGLGDAGRDLDQRWVTPAERERVQRRAAFLRSVGIQVLTLTDPDDAVVRPDEALLPAPGESMPDLLVQATGVNLQRPLGHGRILDEKGMWRRIYALIGDQERTQSTGEAHPGAAPPADDSLDRELEALKARLRAEGRLPRT